MEKQHFKVNIQKIVKDMSLSSNLGFSEHFLNNLIIYCESILDEISEECVQICNNSSKSLLTESHFLDVLKKKKYEFLIREIIEDHKRYLYEENDTKKDLT